MSYNILIMELLEEKGLDKRFRNNPEAVSQICSLIGSDIEEKIGKSIHNSNGNEIKEIISRVLEGNDDYVTNDGIRHNNYYSINQDGSFSFNHKTDSKDMSGTVTRHDSKQIFSIGEKRGDLIVTESYENMLQTHRPGVDNTFARTGVRFNVFNSYGLEMQQREVSQSVDVEATYGIKNTRDAFHALARSDVGRQWKVSPVTETILERSPDLATVNYYIQESNNCRWMLIFQKDSIIGENKGKDAISNPIPITSSLGGYPTGQTKTGELANIPPEYRPGHLIGYTDRAAEIQASLTEVERDGEIQRAYILLAAESEAFRKTLNDSAKTNPKLQKVAEKLGLVRTTKEKEMVRVADLERNYARTKNEESRSVMEAIKSASKAGNMKLTKDGKEK